jgi:tetratricopeptide (TPR) repeat protein
MPSWQDLYRIARLFLLAPNKVRKGLDVPESLGHSSIVNRFSQIRNQPSPPVLVIEGSRGSGKSHLMTRLRSAFRMDQAWLLAEDLDARIDMSTTAPEPEPALMLVRSQLRRPHSSLWRPAPTPRFDLMRAHLARHRRHMGAAGPPTGAIAADLEWLVRAGVKVAGSVQAGGVPLVAPSMKAGPLRWVRLARTQLGIGRAAKWVKAEVARLPGTNIAGERDVQRLHALEGGLARAMAEDLGRATSRDKLRVGQILILIDAYHRVESSTNPRWVVEFADALQRVRAHVILVVACRHQRLWTEHMEADATLSDYKAFKASTAIEVHRLRPLEWQECRYTLANYRVPANLVDGLATISRGHPLALRLLGMHFGRHGGGGLDPADNKLLSQLPKGKHVDEEWVADFCSIIGPSILEGLSRSIAFHARAAAALRAFDRPLLAKVMGDSFRGGVFKELLETPLIETLTATRTFPSEHVYRIRAFARGFWQEDLSEIEAQRGWHQRAADHFRIQADAAGADPEREFETRAEVLFHELCLGSDEAEQRFATAFVAALRSGRLDHCEMLLQSASDAPLSRLDWKARVAVMAGRMYLAAHQYELAEERLLEASELMAGRKDDDLVVAISQTLAKCYRLQGRLDEARQETAAVLKRAANNPVARFQAIWTNSLLATSAGDLRHAEELADTAEWLLDDLLSEEKAQRSTSLAQQLGIGRLPRKRVHMQRHRADLARRRGDYLTATRLIDAAEQGYADEPEDSAVWHLRVLRSHVLRAEGLTDAAIDTAEAVRADIARSTSSDRRASLLAVRCLAQAKLASGDTQSARSLFAALCDSDPGAYPPGRIIGHWGLGELDRLAGDAPGAAKSYRAALEDRGESRTVFERTYAQLGLAEVERMRGDIDRSLERLKRFELLDICAAHPSLRFWCDVFAARALFARDGPEGEGSLERLRRAEESAAAFVHGSGNLGLERDVTARLRETLRHDADAPSPAMLLP